MTKLTNKGKIKRLRKLLWLNFKYNFMSRITYGLCGLYREQYNSKQYNVFNHTLFNELPELYEFKIRNSSATGGYWWPRGRVIGWWCRHWAIIRTIWKLKKSL
jgi:hypothetical protein